MPTHHHPEQLIRNNRNYIIKNMSSKKPLIVLFGRTNVGKSTLFNTLTGNRQAITSNVPGTTRDSNINIAEWQGKEFELVDTGGIMDMKFLTEKGKKTDGIETEVQKQARDYLTRADLILFLVDARDGFLPHDKKMADFIKKDKKLKEKTIVVANKADSMKLRMDTAEFNKLGIGEPMPVSAANGSGTGDLLDLMVDKIDWRKVSKKTEIKEIPESIKVCVIGKPNVGKSSLLNSIIGYERVIVSDIAHTTREPQNTKIMYKEKEITLVDTAGISKRGQKQKGLQKFGIEKSLKSLNQSDIALLVIDINKEITQQELKIMDEIIERQKSLIIIANKWDLVEERNTKKYTEYIYSKIPFATFAPIQFTSALTGEKVKKIMDLILEIDESRKIKISDSVLNKFLNKIVKIHKPPKASGTKKPRIYQLKQVNSNPPIFEIRIGAKDTLHYSYLRFIENRLREKFGFLGTPINVYIDKSPRVHGRHEEGQLIKKQKND